jgi:phosphoenolpyruvate phosphomutase
MKPGKQLRRSLHVGATSVAASAHSPLSAALVEEAGFPVVWASGLELSASRGTPDANILTMTDVLESARQIAASVDVPVLADCDSGFGDVGNVIEMVRQFEGAGVAGVCIEDKIFPKVNSFAGAGQDLIPVDAMVAKILAAVDARRHHSFVIVARLESLIAGAGLDDAVRRAEAYELAGADALLIHSKLPHAKEIRAFASSYRGNLPLIAVPTTYSAVSAAELHEMGIALVIYANQTLRTAVKAMRAALRTIITDGTAASIEDRMVRMDEILEMQGMSQLLGNKLNYEERAHRLLSDSSDSASDVA